MNLQERMALIDKKIENDKKKAIEAEIAEKEANRLAKEKLQHCFSARAKELIALGEYCIAKKVEFPCVGYGVERHIDFFTDSWGHYYGFEEFSDGTLKIGWANGGACGDYSVYWDGYEIFYMGCSSHTRGQLRYGVSTKEIEKMYNGFPIFEQRFLEWFDKTFAKSK